MKWEQGDKGCIGTVTPITCSSSEVLLIPLDLVKLFSPLFFSLRIGITRFVHGNAEPDMHSVPVLIEVVEVCLTAVTLGLLERLIRGRALP